ncbi:hypothetical protein CR513_43145, partial [Mucuna pruriens]
MSFKVLQRINDNAYVPTQERLGLQEARWPRRSCPGQESPFSTEPNFSTQITPKGHKCSWKVLLNSENRITHTLHYSRSRSIPSVVHGALVRRLVDRGGVGVEFGKPKSRPKLSRLYLRSALFESSSTLSESDSAQVQSDFVRVHHRDEKKHYQIGAVARDTSSFVSLCTKSESMQNPESVECQLLATGLVTAFHKLTATINQLHSKRFKCSPSQTIPSLQEETMSDTTVKSGKELQQQQ